MLCTDFFTIHLALVSLFSCEIVWYNISMNETQLILNALQMPSPKKRTKLVMKELHPCDEVADPENKVIEELVRKQVRRRKSEKRNLKKSILDWTSTDFIRHVEKMLSSYGLTLQISLVRDRNTIARINDLLVKKLGDSMSNLILKDYLEWWVSVNAPFLHDTVYLGALASETTVGKFTLRIPSSQQIEPEDQKIVKETKVDPEMLLKMGGLSMVLCSSGIVLTCSLLSKKGEKNVFSKVSSELRGLSEGAVRQSIESTLKNAPYSLDQSIDFISIARSAIEFHGLKDYKNISYRDYFK